MDKKTINALAKKVAHESYRAALKKFAQQLSDETAPGETRTIEPGKNQFDASKRQGPDKSGPSFDKKPGYGHGNINDPQYGEIAEHSAPFTPSGIDFPKGWSPKVPVGKPDAGHARELPYVEIDGIKYQKALPGDPMSGLSGEQLNEHFEPILYADDSSYAKDGKCPECGHAMKKKDASKLSSVASTYIKALKK